MEGYPSGHKGVDLKSIVTQVPRVRILPPPPKIAVSRAATLGDAFIISTETN